MKVVKCTNAHYFDLDKYTCCPHCGAPVAPSGQTPDNDAKKEQKKGGLFGLLHGGKKEVKNETPINVVAETPPAAAPGWASHTVPFDFESATEKQGAQQNSDVTVSLEDYNANYARQPQPIATPQQFNGVAPMASQGQPPVIPQAVPQNQASAAPPAPTPQIDTVTEQSIQDTIRKAVEGNEEKTMSFFSSKTSANVSATNVAQTASSAASAASLTGEVVAAPSQEPVCGWLVCVEGKYIGGCFQVYAGKNSIGRGKNNRIILAEDDHISREHHALIIYEPKKRNFYIQPGDSSGLTYLNDEYIMEPKQLKNRDRIEIGQCKFLFIPLCGEDFSWEEYLK